MPRHFFCTYSAKQAQRHVSLVVMFWEKNGVEKAVKSKEIKHVWHFTRLTNLRGILSHGLLSKQSIVDSQLFSCFNDEHRLDAQEGSICCSLGHPNYKMFYRLREENPASEWVVLALKPSVLWKKDCAFCITNAASNEVTDIPVEQRKGTIAFNRLFSEVSGKPSRNDLGISDSCPTDPQAEVLVFGNIETKYIIGVATQSKKTKEVLKTKYPDFKFLYHERPFSPRKDYQYWK